MSRRRPARRITQKNNSIGGVCRLTYCNPKQIGGILIAKLIVAEKPSVAMSYAKVLGATRRQDGYLEGNGYLVSWCVGHLVELAPPNIYDAKYVKWSIADLPILPQKWQYLVSASTKKQFGILQKLMNRPDVDSIVNSCDSGREGELIFRLVYQQAGCKKPVSRLWLSSMEENAIREGFAHLKPSTEYDALYNAALCRERADWMVGINASRLFSCLYTENKKAELFSKVRSGQVRVLLGSTAKMGAGTNVQTLLVAVHHLDVGWRPSDMTQRNGRIIRQGNQNKQVYVYNYVTESTFDAYLYVRHEVA